MIRIEPEPWNTMLAHARAAYPSECCGAMLGRLQDASKLVTAALPLENTFQGSQRTRYEIHPEDLLAAAREARRVSLRLIGVYHSHPDCDAYFSQTDLKNSWPWYSFLVLALRKGEFDHANCWLPDARQTSAEQEELIHPETREDAPPGLWY